MNQPTTPTTDSRINLLHTGHEHDHEHTDAKPKAKRAGCVCDCGDCPCKTKAPKPASPPAASQQGDSHDQH